MSVPVFFRRMFPPRQNSCPIVPTTIADIAKQSPDDHTRTPSAASPAAVTSASPTGKRNESRRFESVDLRHASNGPTPVRNSSTKPIGTIHLLKNGAATVRRWPVMASLSVGNMVANSTNSAANNSTQLLTMNAASRDIHESSSLRALSSGSR